MSIQTQEKEELLATDLQLVSLLKNNPDILLRHPELVAELEVPHQSGAAVSLIERQVGSLRENLKTTEKRMRELMDIAKDNDRLAQSRHRLAINLLNAHDLDDVISTISDELWAELKADFVHIKLFSDNEKLKEKHPDLFISISDESVNCFSTMLKHKNPMCGRSTSLSFLNLQMIKHCTYVLCVRVSAIKMNHPVPDDSRYPSVHNSNVFGVSLYNGCPARYLN